MIEILIDWNCLIVCFIVFIFWFVGFVMNVCMYDGDCKLDGKVVLYMVI